ncbi:MAG: hypothetical protein ACYDH5_15085 [Acidimicrobiales bacterium]
MTVKPATKAALLEAMKRLLSGRPERCDGEMSVSNLAREAGVSRATANRATDVLAEFDRCRAHAAESAEHRLRVESHQERIRHLEAELAGAKAAARAEDSELRRRSEQLAQQVQTLALENHRLHQQLADGAKVRSIVSGSARDPG